MPRYEISSDPARLDVAAVHAFLSQSYWSAGIPLATVARAIEHSICVGAYAGKNQVGFARMVSDQATFAYLADVYVLEDHRGQGLARRMMDKLKALPELQGLRRLMLATRDAHGLYERFGFKPLAAPERFMELHRPDAYATAPRPGATLRLPKSTPPADVGKAPAVLIDARIHELGGWRGGVLARVRTVIRDADPGITEEWKWNVPVWVCKGIICTGEAYAKAVKLTFPKGTALADPLKLFNSSLTGNQRRAIDIAEGATIDEAALRDLVRAAVRLNNAGA